MLERLRLGAISTPQVPLSVHRRARYYDSTFPALGVSPDLGNPELNTIYVVYRRENKLCMMQLKGNFKI
jgi:hypothetical protein